MMEHQWLVKYVDCTLDTISLTVEEVEALKLHPGIKEVRVLVGTSTIALDEAALLFEVLAPN